MQIKKSLKERRVLTAKDVVKKINIMNLNKKAIDTINEKNFNRVLRHYKFDKKDAKLLKGLESSLTIHTKELLEGFYKFIFEFDHAKVFLHNKEILQRHKKGIENWFINLFCGKYDEKYFEKLHIISEIHVRIGLPPHYVNTAFSYVRSFVKDILIKKNLLNTLGSWDKIIDINLDILTIAYREEEQTKLVEDTIFLKNAIEHKNIIPYAQAIFNTKTSKIEKYEALMRIKDKETKRVSSVFPYLETSKKLKLYDKMMEIMVKKTFKLFCNKKFEFSLNLSYEDIANPEFRDTIYKKIENCTNAKKVIFEILESDFIEDFSIVEEFTKNLREYGCKIAIDDFGSGYSSMENILKLKPDIIKIDGSLIKNIDTSIESKTIVKNIIIMAKELKAQTVAEYVHSKEVYEVVKNLGVDYLQGYYLGKPEKLI